MKLDIRNVEDFRSYKVAIDGARIELGYEPQYSIKDIVDELYDHRAEFTDFERDEYYNIRVFKRLASVPQPV